MKEEIPRETPEDSRADENSQSASKSANQTVKDRKCQYCNQAFTSSSLGRHLDQFLFKKKPDGIHDVEEIRRIRSGITRRQARSSTVRLELSPDRVQKKGSSENLAAPESSAKSQDAPVRMMFNTPTWHATGVINDIPNPSRSLDGPSAVPSQSRSGSLQLPDYASRGATANNPDTMKALELALREVLDNIRAATYAPAQKTTKLSNKLTQSELDRASVLDYLRSTSISKAKPFRPSACSSSLPHQACSRPTRFLLPRLFRSNLRARSISTSSVKRSARKSHNGTLTKRPTPQPTLDTQAVALTIV